MTDKVSEIANPARTFSRSLSEEGLDIVRSMREKGASTSTTGSATEKASAVEKTTTEKKPAEKLSAECQSLLGSYNFIKMIYDEGGRSVKNPYPDLDKKYVDYGCNFEKPMPDWENNQKTK